MGDMISRQAAIGALASYIYNVDRVCGTGRLTDEDCKDAAQSVLDEVPSAQPDAPDIGVGDMISRQAAIDAIQNNVEPFVIVEPGTTCVIGAGIKNADVIRELENLPSAEQEIIRCKDCKWWSKQDASLQGRCSLLKMYPTGGWYCGNAERREEIRNEVKSDVHSQRMQETEPVHQL